MLKKVMFPLYVPEGSYCYQGIDEDDYIICPYLTIDGGFVSCKLDFEPEREDGSIEILKDSECRELEI